MVLAAVCAQLLAATAEPEALLERAEQALRRVDYREASAGFEAACTGAPCSRLQLQRVYVGLATIQASLGQATRAIETYQALLVVAPDYELPQGSSPRLRDPFELARQYWRSRPAPRLAVVPSGAPVTEVAVRLESDPLRLCAGLAVRAQRGDTALDLQPVDGAAPEGGCSQRFTVPPGDGPWQLTAQARTANGSVLLESAPLEVNRPAPPPPPQVAAQAEPVPEPRPLLHLTAGVVFEPRTLRLGAEARLSVSPTRFLDVSAGALFGRNTGLRVALELHLPRSYRFSPLGQLRFALHPLPGQVVVGAGAAVGASVELGPGRVWLMAVGELFAAPASFTPWAVSVMAGYELDLPFVTVR